MFRVLREQKLWKRTYPLIHGSGDSLRPQSSAMWTQYKASFTLTNTTPSLKPTNHEGLFLHVLPIMDTSQLTGGEWQGDSKPIRKFWHICDSLRWGKMLEGHKKKWLTSCTSHALKMSWPKYVMTVLVMTQINLKPTVLQFAQQAGLMRLMHMLHSSY